MAVHGVWHKRLSCARSLQVATEFHQFGTAVRLPKPLARQMMETSLVLSTYAREKEDADTLSSAFKMSVFGLEAAEKESPEIVDLLEGLAAAYGRLGDADRKLLYHLAAWRIMWISPRVASCAAAAAALLRRQSPLAAYKVMSRVRPCSFLTAQAPGCRCCGCPWPAGCRRSRACAMPRAVCCVHTQYTDARCLHQGTA